MSYDMDFYRDSERSQPVADSSATLAEDNLPEEADWGNQAMIDQVVSEEVQAETGETPEPESDEEEEALGPGGFDYHGEALVDPEVAHQDAGDIPDSIYTQVYQDAIAGMPFEHIPEEDREAILADARAEAELAVARYEALLDEEMAGSLPEEALHHIPQEDREAIEKLAREQALHRLNVGHTGGIGELDLESMNPTQQYNYLHDLVLRSGGEFTEEDLEVNLIGIRGLNVEGETHDNALGEDGKAHYDDTIFAVRMVDGKPEVYRFAATTDYGDRSDLLETGFGYDDPDGEREYLLLAEGSYQMYMNGNIMSMDEDDLKMHALREGSSRSLDPVNSVLDVDRDRQVDPEELENNSYTYQGINMHVGGRYDDTKVDSWSAGCQVIPRAPRDEANAPDDVYFYDTFLELLQEDPRAAGAIKGENPSVNYTLANAQNLPGK